MSKRLMVLILGLLMLLVLAAVFHLPIGAWLRQLLTWTEQLGPWGPLLLVGIYVVGGVLMLPGSILTVGTGFLYGVPLGFLLVWIANTLGACAAFGVGRTIARDWVARRVANNEKFASLDKAVGVHGFKIVLLTRLSPAFPYNFLNYVFGVSRVSFRQYALASMLGLIPGILMYVYIGAGLRPLVEAAAHIEDPTPESIVHHVFFWFGLVVTVVLAVAATRIARKALAATSSARSDPPLAAGTPTDAQDPL
jgi:uncharacterized membrane protein YdjX (TVP38/TMEM64 family)